MYFHSIASRNFPKVLCVANIIISWTWQVNLHIHFYFAGVLSSEDDFATHT